MSSAANTEASFACGACDHLNTRQNQFCSGCGQPLWDKCPDCGQRCLIGQNFCNGCGKDLKADGLQRVESCSAELERAEQLSANGFFDDAIRLAKRMQVAPDFRFAQVAERAQQLLTTLEGQQASWNSKLEEIAQELEPLREQKRFVDIAALLSTIPEGMLSEEWAAELESARDSSTLVDTAKNSLKSAVDDRDWTTAMSEVVQLLTIYPGKSKYVDLAKKIAAKITKAARAERASGNHSAALRLLEVIPTDHQPEGHETLLSGLEELLYLRKLVAKSPVAYPIIFAAIDKLGKLTPDDTIVQKLAGKAQKVRRDRPERRHYLYPDWMKPAPGLLPEPVRPATLPERASGARPPAVQKAGAQLWTAFGLALQGIDHGVDSADFLAVKKSGMLGMLGRKRRVEIDAACGVDIGDSSIKAVRLVTVDGQIRFDDAVVIPIDTKSDSRLDIRKASDTAVYHALEKLFKQKAYADTPIVASAPSGDLLCRNFELPVGKEKQHAAFIEQEAQANIPISLEQLNTAYVKYEAENESSILQRAILLAARKTAVDSRRTILERAGGKLAAMVAEPFAQLNLMKHFGYFQLTDESQSSEANLLIDVGHFRTTFAFFTLSGMWHRTIDWGIADINKFAAHKLKLTIADAEAIRRSPSRWRTVSEAMGALKQACHVPNRELDRSYHAATEFLGQFKIKTPLLIGGGAYQSLLGSWINGEDI